MPRYYSINGVKYDIDNPDDIRRIPLFKTKFQINGETFGMDSVLNEHCIQATTNMDVHWAAYNKVQEYRSNGIIFKSQREIQREKAYQQGQIERRKTEDARMEQCNSFSIKDMEQFSDIPFSWHYISKLRHTNGVSWFMLNLNNQKIALDYISKINDIIVDAHQYIDGIDDAYIDLNCMDFDYPVHMRKNSMCNTRVECYPYTSSGRISKYPAIIQFATKIDHSGSRTIGEIKILCDGNIGAASVLINGCTFKIGLHGVSLVLLRVDCPYMGGNLFNFSENYD